MIIKFIIACKQPYQLKMVPHMDNVHKNRHF